MKPNKSVFQSNKESVAFFKCACSAHALNVMKYEGEEEEVYLSIWERGTNIKLPFLQRLRHCWKILKDGTPYGDELVFNKETTKKLAKYLTALYK